MTVKELIEELKKCPEDKEVKIQDCEFLRYHDVSDVCEKACFVDLEY